MPIPAIVVIFQSEWNLAMNMQQIRYIASAKGINTSRLSKMELIRALQNREGNPVCFATDAEGKCDRYDCMWRADCLQMSQKLKA